MDNPPPVLTEQRDGLLTVTLHRPQRKNALTVAALEQLAAAFQTAATAPEVRAVVLEGSGGTFCSGFDLEGFPQADAAPGQRQSGLGAFTGALRAIATCPRPVVAKIEGFAVGAGCELAATCDLRLAADSARLGMPPAKLGLVYPLEGHQRFVDLLGVANTALLFLTARLFPAAEAQRLGLVQQVVAAEELDAATAALTGELTANAPLSVAASKRMLRACRYGADAAEREALAQLVVTAEQSADAVEARTAFLEKRKPRFRGR